MVLHYSARRTACAAGIDDAGGLIALHARNSRLNILARRSRIPFEHFGPVMIIKATRLMSL